VSIVTVIVPIAFMVFAVILCYPDLVNNFLLRRHERKLKALEVRALEARARIGLPDYVDADDPAEVEAYREARKEIVTDLTKAD
jgi:hypothetical protein